MLIFSILFAGSIQAQYYVFEQLASAKYYGRFIANDDLGNLLIADQSKIIKLNADGQLITDYISELPGRITSIDTKDPRRILVFYKDYASVVFLNQELLNAGSVSTFAYVADPTAISLDGINLGYSSLACLHDSEEAYWIYDGNTSDLVLIDSDNQIDFKGDALDQFTDLEPDPNFMVMEGKRLFINNPSSGVYIFDENGSFVNKLPLLGLKKIQVFKNILFYTSNTFLVAYDMDNDKETYHPLPVFNISDWSLNLSSFPGRISFLTPDGVQIFTMEKE